jgi:hypothetical protein
VGKSREYGNRPLCYHQVISRHPERLYVAFLGIGIYFPKSPFAMSIALTEHALHSKVVPPPCIYSNTYRDNMENLSRVAPSTIVLLV